MGHALQPPFARAAVAVVAVAATNVISRKRMRELATIYFVMGACCGVLGILELVTRRGHASDSIFGSTGAAFVVFGIVYVGVARSWLRRARRWAASDGAMPV